MREHEDLRFQTHLNENATEVTEVAWLFLRASDYFGAYERYGLMGRLAVMAHNVHPTVSKLERLATTHRSVSLCPCSKSALGSGIFPFAAHLEAGVHCALGTQVGGGPASE